MVDVQRQLDAVTRGVTTGERDGAETRVQTLAQTYPAPIEDVWDAVTTDRIGRWFLPISGDLRLGGRRQPAPVARTGAEELGRRRLGADGGHRREATRRGPPVQPG